MTMQETVITRCPACESILDAVTPVDGKAVLKPGDVSICFYCATVLEWTGNSYDRASQDALEVLQPEHWHLRDAILANITRRKP